eukprot:scaffold636527_cov24-Prasinocladus_malaysianus.AAC.1
MLHNVVSPCAECRPSRPSRRLDDVWMLLSDVYIANMLSTTLANYVVCVLDDNDFEYARPGGLSTT